MADVWNLGDWPFGDWLASRVRNRDVSADRLHYTGVTLMASHVVAGRLAEAFAEREECARYPDQVVWSSDGHRAVVVWTAIGEHGRANGGRLTMEVWASKDGYHARLNDLARVPSEKAV